MKAIKYNQLDCQMLADALKGKVTVTEIENLTGKVPHVGFGGASKSSYESPKTGKTIYVLERNGLYAPDAWINDVWQFDADFTIQEATNFLTTIDTEKRQQQSFIKVAD